MSIDAINWVFELQDLTPTEKIVLLSFANRSNDKTHIAWPSWSRLIHDTALKRTAIHTSLISLCKKGYLMKTGDKIKQVYVYKIIGVLNKEELKKFKSEQKNNKKLSTTSSPNELVRQTYQFAKRTSTSSPNELPLVRQTNIEPSLESKKESKLGDSIFLPIKTQIQNQLLKHELEVTDDIVGQIEFYVDSKPEQTEEQTIRVAVSLHKRGIWKIPNGYNGITSQSIREDEEAQQLAKRNQYQEEVAAFRSISQEAANREVAKSHLAGLLSSLKPNYNPSIRLADE